MVQGRLHRPVGAHGDRGPVVCNEWPASAAQAVERGKVLTSGPDW